MEISFDVEWTGTGKNTVKWSIVPNDGGRVPAGTLEIMYTYVMAANDTQYAVQQTDSYTVYTGDIAFGFITPPSNANSIANIVKATFKNDSTTYASRGTSHFEDDPTGKVSKQQGTANTGKVLGIGSNGMVTPVDAGGFGEWTKITALSELSSNLTLGKTLVAKRLECANNITVVGVNVVALETVAGRLICYGSFSGVLKNGDFYSGMGSYIAFSSGRLIANVLANDSSTEYVVQNFDTMFIR